jgi:hypothetical protein
LKVKVINNGVESTVDAGYIVIGEGLTLNDLLKRFIKLENDTRKKLEELEKREQTLKAMVKKLG